MGLLPRSPPLYQGDTIKDEHRIYIHYYCNVEKGADDEQTFDERPAKLREELLSGKIVEKHKGAYFKYFGVKDTPKRGRQVHNQEAEIKDQRCYFGHFALITNEKMDTFTALYPYPMKDVAEKAFGNLKERLNMGRLLVSSERTLEGKIFVGFVALILISYLNQKMKESNLYNNSTMNQLLDKIDVIECFEDTGRSLGIGELLNKQVEICEALGVDLSTSL